MHLTPHCSKVKSHLKFTELDINASQACSELYLMLVTGLAVVTDVQGVVQRDLVAVRHDLVKGGVV